MIPFSEMENTLMFLEKQRGVMPKLMDKSNANGPVYGYYYGERGKLILSTVLCSFDLKQRKTSKRSCRSSNTRPSSSSHSNSSSRLTLVSV